jgi:hypothetical protein
MSPIRTGPQVLLLTVLIAVVTLGSAAGLGVFAYRAGLSEEREYEAQKFVGFTKRQLDFLAEARAAEGRGDAGAAASLRAQAQWCAKKVAAARRRIREIDGN